jgi:hypothetical protein
MFDQLEGGLNAAQTGLGLTFDSPHPKPVNLAARRQPEVDPVGDDWFPSWLSCDSYTAQISLSNFVMTKPGPIGTHTPTSLSGCLEA